MSRSTKRRWVEEDVKLPRSPKSREWSTAKDDWKIAITGGTPPTLYVFTKQSLLDAQGGLRQPCDSPRAYGQRQRAPSQRERTQAPRPGGSSRSRQGRARRYQSTQAALHRDRSRASSGLGALEDSIARPASRFPLQLSCAALAAGLSPVGDACAHDGDIRARARLDLVRSRYESMVSGPVKASNRGLVLLARLRRASRSSRSGRSEEDEKEQNGRDQHVASARRKGFRGRGGGELERSRRRCLDRRDRSRGREERL